MFMPITQFLVMGRNWIYNSRISRLYRQLPDKKDNYRLTIALPNFESLILESGCLRMFWDLVIGKMLFGTLPLVLMASSV